MAAHLLRMKNGTLRIALGADHGGVEVKSAISAALQEAGNEVVDFGTNSEESVDYPDYAQRVAKGACSGNQIDAQGLPWSTIWLHWGEAHRTSSGASPVNSALTGFSQAQCWWISNVHHCFDVVLH